MPRFKAFFPVLALYLVGCSCQKEQDYSFPEAQQVNYATPPDAIGTWLSLDVAPDQQRITMSYYDIKLSGMAYAVGTISGDEISWLHERVDGFPGSNGLDPSVRGEYSSQKTAPDGTVWLAYYDSGAGDLYVSHRLGPTNWEEPVLVDAGGAESGKWASLALDSNGSPFIAYCNEDELKVARINDGAWNTTVLFKGQSAEVTDDLGNVTTVEARVEQSKAFSAGGKEFISFFDKAAGTLHLLTGSTGKFSDEVVDGGNVGAWSSLWSNGENIFLAYQDVKNQSLKLANFNNGSWAISTIDSGQLRGADTEIFVESGVPTILYFDGYNNNLLSASPSGSDWNTTPVFEAGMVGFHNETVEINGQRWVASYDYTSKQMVIKPL